MVGACTAENVGAKVPLSILNPWTSTRETLVGHMDSFKCMSCS